MTLAQTSKGTAFIDLHISILSLMTIIQKRVFHVPGTVLGTINASCLLIIAKSLRQVLLLLLFYRQEYVAWRDSVTCPYLYHRSVTDLGT